MTRRAAIRAGLSTPAGDGGDTCGWPRKWRWAESRGVYEHRCSLLYSKPQADVRGDVCTRPLDRRPAGSPSARTRTPARDAEPRLVSTSVCARTRRTADANRGRVSCPRAACAPEAASARRAPSASGRTPAHALQLHLDSRTFASSSERGLPTRARFPASASASELHASLGLRLPRRATDLAPACHICNSFVFCGRITGSGARRPRRRRTAQ